MSNVQVSKCPFQAIWYSHIGSSSQLGDSPHLAENLSHLPCIHGGPAPHLVANSKIRSQSRTLYNRVHLLASINIVDFPTPIGGNITDDNIGRKFQSISSRFPSLLRVPVPSGVFLALHVLALPAIGWNYFKRHQCPKCLGYRL